jgi:hypothetical protein
MVVVVVVVVPSLCYQTSLGLLLSASPGAAAFCFSGVEVFRGFVLLLVLLHCYLLNHFSARYLESFLSISFLVFLLL